LAEFTGGCSGLRADKCIQQRNIVSPRNGYHFGAGTGPMDVQVIAGVTEDPFDLFGLVAEGITRVALSLDDVLVPATVGVNQAAQELLGLMRDDLFLPRLQADVA
jgi:hypothetical protein